MLITNRLTPITSKFLFWGFAAIVLVIINATIVRADPIVFTGSAQGSFNSGAFGSTSSMNGLTFTGADFTAATDEYGRLFYNGPPFILGYFSVSDEVGFAPTDRFNLQITFNPSNGVSPNPVLIEASFGVTGITNILPVNFDNRGGGALFTFHNGEFTGAGRLGVGTEFNLRPGQTDVPLYGTIFFTDLNPPHPTPEPATLVLLSIGLAGVAARVRRHRKAAKTE